jgi:hypothetical protein
MRGTPLRAALLRSLLFAFAFFLSLSPQPRAAAGEPKLDGLRLVAELPAELPKRVSGLAFDGKKIWVVIYHGGGLYATLDPSTLGWEVGREEARRAAFREVAGSFQAPSGVCFAGERLWVGGSYGDSFGYIDTRDWKVGRAFKGRLREDPASQSYQGLACDGTNVWMAWHWFKYSIPTTRTQLLLKVDAQTGKVVAEYPLPAGTAPDMTHGLTWDGERLWHMKDSLLCSINPANGYVIRRYGLPDVKRASGLAWDGESLWIAEFDGKLWRLPF